MLFVLSTIIIIFIIVIIIAIYSAEKLLYEILTHHTILCVIFLIYM